MCIVSAPSTIVLNKSLRRNFMQKKSSQFIRKWFQPNSFGDMCNLGESLQIDAIMLNFEKFEAALYMKSVSMPIR